MPPRPGLGVCQWPGLPSVTPPKPRLELTMVAGGVNPGSHYKIEWRLAS